MTNNHRFRKRLIASAVASVASSALAGLPGLSHAQDDNSHPVVEEVLVTGLRASLQRSMDLKRDAQGVVDAISAEDIGKFPDTNLAESLQRITGVSIDRQNGEGSKVTVRGLGPEFNLVTLNGRQMPGANIGETFASGSRSFDFGNLASEGVSAVEVYKTSRADITPGGMGATINIVTPRPLDNPARASLGIKGVWDESSEDSELTPEISGIYSDTFADGKFGVAVTASYQERQGGYANATTGAGWTGVPGTVVQDWSGDAVEGVDNMWGGIDFLNGAHRNQPQDNDVYGAPQQVVYSFGEFERKRTNGQLTLQFAPVETLTATLDYTYSQNELETTYNDLGAWFGWGGQSTIFTENTSPSVQTPVLYSEDATNGDLAMGSGVNSVVAENNSFGLNIEWNPVEPLTLTLDAHSSEAEVRPDSPYGNSVGVSVSAFVRDRTTLNSRGEVPGLILDIVDRAGGTDLRTEDLKVSGSYFRNSESKHEIDQIQLDGRWEFNDGLAAKFGVGRVKGDYTSAFSEVQRGSWNGLGEFGDLPADMFTRQTILDRFSGSVGSVSAEEMAFLGGSNTELMNERFSFDFYELRQFAADNYDDGEGAAECADNSTWYCAVEPDSYNQISETTDSAYVQLNFETVIATMPFAVNAGLRHEKTEVETPATAQDYGPITWAAVNELNLPKVGAPTSITDSGDYSFTLPALDLRLNVTDDLVVRASYGESIARPDWLQLRGGTSYNQLIRIDGGDASRGTPGLEPYKSDNIDLSVEWYYGEASYVSVGYFTKDVSSFIGSRVVEEEGPLDNTPHPAMGPRAQAAIASGISPTDAEGIRQYIYNNFPDPDTAYLNASGNIVIVGIPGEDPNTPFDITENYNSDRTVTIDGWELALQHNFWDTGFGMIANYTFVDESIGYDVMELTGEQTPVTGVSDTANLIGFYEKDRFQARIAYNWRDAFLASQTIGTGNNPLFVDDYSQIDLNVSYDVTDQFTVFFEGLNVTEESISQYSRSKDQIMGWYEGSARYNIGARYVF